MITVREQYYLNHSVVAGASLIRSGRIDPATKALKHLEDEPLSDEHKRDLFSALFGRLPFDIPNADAYESLSRLLGDLGVLTYVYADSFHWRSSQCLITSVVDGLIKAGLPVVEQSLFDSLDSQFATSSIVTLGSFLTPERSVLYENERQQFWTLNEVDIEEDAALVVEQPNRSTRRLSNVLMEATLYNGTYEAAVCDYDYGRGIHDRYDITLTLGQPPLFKHVYDPLAR
jgi:hypothetical protein